MSFLPFRPSSAPSQTRILELMPQHQSSQIAIHEPDVTADGITTWRAKISKASKVERETFLQYGAADLQQYTAAIEKTVQDHGKSSFALRVARSLKPLFDTMNLYAPIAQTMIQADPTSSSLVLGGITCIMAISSRFLGYQEKTAEMLSDMLKRLDILVKYGENVYENNTQMKQALMEVYGDILDFCIQASRLFLDDKGKTRGSLKTFLTSIGTSFESKFSAVLEKFDKDIKYFEEAALYVDRERGEADRKAKVIDRTVDHYFMQHQICQGERIHRGIGSIRQQMLVTGQKQLEEAENRTADDLRVRGEKRRKVMKWLPSISFRNDQEDKHMKRLHGTGRWLLDNETFQAWKASSSAELLWIHGKHGCGKSYLAARVVMEITEERDRLAKDKRTAKDFVALAYIYCSSLEAAKIDPSKLIGSLLNQLCEQLPYPEIEKSLESIYDRQTEAPIRQEMQGAIVSIMSRFSRTFIIIDGLDECHRLEDGQFEDLCEFINSLAQPKAMGSVAKVLVLSRPEYPAIKDEFGACLEIQVDGGANDDDIKKFISKKVSGKGLHVSGAIREEVESALLSNADGMFLWVDLSVKTLKGSRTAKEIRAKLHKMPQGLENVYEASLKRILDQDDKDMRTRALKILLWTTNAKRPLSREELKEALAIEPGTNKLDNESDSKIHDDSGFAAECGDLVVLRNGHYHLLHSSLKDYLGNISISSSNSLQEYKSMQRGAARILGETCLIYLMFDVFKNGPVESEQDLANLQEQHPFLLYAAVYWGRHVADSKGLDLQELTENFLSSSGARELSMQVFMQERGETVIPYPGTTPTLHFLSIFNLIEIARVTLEAPLMRTARDGFDFTPLDHALFEESKEVCIWLLESMTTPLASTEFLHSRCELMHSAAAADWGDILVRLISLGYDPEVKNWDREQTPLHIAAFEGSESALNALLDAKVNIDPVDNDGTTPLIDAAGSNHPRLVTRLLEAGANVNVHGWNGTTALHHAVNHGDLSMAKALFEKGAEVDPVSGEGWDCMTPLHIAVELGALDMTEVLIENGADIHKIDAKGNTALLLSCYFGSLVCLERLLKENAPIDVRNTAKQTCVHHAAMNGSCDILEFLLERCDNPNLINSIDANGHTPLHNAIFAGKKAAVRFLLENGALVDQLTNNGRTVLEIAVTEGHIEIFELLLTKSKADVNQKGLSGSLALHHAARLGRCDVIPLLLQAGADPTIPDDDLDTVPHLAAMGGSLELLKNFVEAIPGLNLAPRNRLGQTPLHQAASKGDVGMVKYLLEQEISSVQVEDNDKDLPLHSASWMGHLEVVKLLLNDGNINAPGFFGRTPLFGASYYGHTPLLKFLLERNADVNKLDDDRESPLHAALETKNIEVANILLDYRADPTLANKYGVTALHVASGTEDKKIVRRLLAEHCDGLAKDWWGVTPFMLAIASRKVEIVDAFLEYGFDGTAIPTESGETCVHFAAEAGSLEMLEKLTAGNKQLALAVDCIGRNAVEYAASAGQKELIGPLVALGLGVDGSEKGPTTPLMSAALKGFVDSVGRLIELKADLDKPVGSEAWGALHAAVALRRPLVAEKLVQAGADPNLRDAFGLSPLDYAIRDPAVWQKMGSARMNYTPIGLQARVPTLRRIIRKCLKIILAQSDREGPKNEWYRVKSLDILAHALTEIGTDSSLEFARICRTQLACQSDFACAMINWVCNVCSQAHLRGTRYHCLRCVDSNLCSLCYADYLEGDLTPMSAPRSLKTLRRLENDIRPIRELGSINSLFGGATFLYNCFETLVIFRRWIDEKLKAYEDWEKAHNKTGRFVSHQRSGQVFLNIVEKIRNWYEDTEIKKDGNDMKGSLSNIEADLVEFYHKHKPDEEMATFTCFEHDHQAIQDKSTMKNVDKQYFGADGKLTTGWLSTLLETYTDSEAETNVVKDVDGIQTPSDGIDLETIGDRDSEAVLVDRMANLSPALTDEPQEIADPVDAVSTKSNQDLVGSLIKSSLDREIPANIKIPRPNMQRLLNIRQILQKGMIEVIGEAKAEQVVRAARVEKLKTDQIQENDWKISDALNNHDDTPIEERAIAGKQEDQDQSTPIIKTEDVSMQNNDIVEHDAASHVLESENGASGGEEKETEEMVLALFILHRALMEREIAWKLAQIILCGSVENCLLDDFFESEDTSKEEGDVEIFEQRRNREESEKEDDMIPVSTEVNDANSVETAAQAPGETSVASEEDRKDKVDNSNRGNGALGENQNSQGSQLPAIYQVKRGQEVEIDPELRCTFENSALPQELFKSYKLAASIFYRRLL